MSWNENIDILERKVDIPKFWESTDINPLHLHIAVMPPRPKAPHLTHFVCLPLATSASTPHLIASINSFAAECIHPCPLAADSGTSQAITERNEKPSHQDHPNSGIPLPPKAIRPVGTLHLTLGVMSLSEKERLDAAVTFLKSLDIKAILNDTASAHLSTDLEEPAVLLAPLKVNLQGLHAMKTPHRTSSLYALPTDTTGRLFPFAEKLRQEFVKAGFVIEENRDLKLHATIVNTLYASVREKGKRGKKALQFDAVEMIEKWKDTVWAEVRLERLAICEMGAKVDEEGWERYVEVEGVDLP